MLELETHHLASTTGVLTRTVEDLQDFASYPDKYLVDLYDDEIDAAKAWLRTGERHHFTYNEGVVTLAWQGTRLLGVPTWDDTCGIWICLVSVVEGYLSTGRGESFFPDQPIQIVLERIRGGALITIGETKLRVEPAAFCRELLEEAERFWRWTETHGIPVHSGTPLADIDRLRAALPQG